MQALNDRQKEAVSHPGGPLLIAAGAGSGKTRTLTERIIHLINSGTDPRTILAITFTNKAADEMKRRIQESGFKPHDMFVGTFHSFGARILRHEAHQVGRNDQFTIFDEDDSFSLVKRILKNRNLSKDVASAPIIRRLISDIKNELGSPNDISEGDTRLDRSTFIAIYEDYEDSLQENNAFDFDDLIEKPVRVFMDNPATLATHQKRHTHILVDEYQDSNTPQYTLMRFLAREHKNISVVGDDAQSIYAFRGADFRNFLNFEKEWPAAKVILLEENYRSTPVILEAANSIIKNNTLQKQKKLWTNNPKGAPIKLYAAEDENDEAEWIVDQIANLSKSDFDRLKDVAILYRTNAQSRALEQTLIAAGIPYRIFGGIRFYERKEIKDVVAGLRFAYNPKDTVSAERIAKSFSKGRAMLLIQNLPAMGKTHTITQLIDYIIANTNYLEYLKNNYTNAEDRLENIHELIVFAGTFLKKGVGPFLEQITLAQAQDNPQGATGVNLMTIHLSKGLEFKTVFIAGVSEGVLPHHRSYNTLEEMEEERRLMYVAVTRAAERLFLSFSNLPSRFLSEIPGDCIDFTRPPTVIKQTSKTFDEEDFWLDYS